jgi:hypothetical protein
LITVTVTLDYANQPVIVFASGGMSTTQQDENERYQGFIEIDGAPGETMYMGVGLVTADDDNDGHTHGEEPSLDVSGVSGSETAGTPHTHTSGSYSAAVHVHAQDTHNHTITVAVADTRTSLGCRYSRNYTPAGATISIKLRGLRSGTPAGWQHDMMYQVFRNG